MTHGHSKGRGSYFSSDDMHKGDVSRNVKENSPCIKEDQDDYGDH